MKTKQGLKNFVIALSEQLLKLIVLSFGTYKSSNYSFTE
jgi:hypothetical protein